MPLSRRITSMAIGLPLRLLATPSLGQGPLGFVRVNGRRLLVLAIVALGITLAYVHRSGGFAGYLLVGDLGLSGHNVYRDAPPCTNTWPPLFALLCIPLAALARISLLGTRTLWLLFNLGMLTLAAAATMRLVYGRGLNILKCRVPPTTVLTSKAAPTSASSSFFVLDSQQLRASSSQYCCLRLALTGLVFHRRGQQAWGGLLIGGPPP